MSDYKPLDPTACGLFFVAVVSLPLAILQFLNQGVPSAMFFNVLGILILGVGLLAYFTGSNFGFCVFGLVGAAVLLTGLGMGPWENITFALLFILSMIWSIWIKTPKVLSIILFTTCLVFLTVGLSGIVGGSGWNIAIGVAALLNFAVNMYLSYALATERFKVV